ncbi:unnamed protein product [Parascedosporium putredinis]|uniref:Uncharacterized protein n=1 Tax=Parascedosporium putredinis TaxID=1442378 RepID=A0A9P1H6T8_9PEZI|nr:unnamed protein product [Parascedosporium putredinis]CAI7998986.1 unnamed protein product [Parascedosporium putredinis]
MSERRRLVRVHADKVGGLEKEERRWPGRTPLLHQRPVVEDLYHGRVPPGMTRDQENKLWAQLQKYKEQAKNLDSNNSA